MNWIVEWSPDPVMINLGGFQLRWYSLMWSLSVVAGYFFARWIFSREQRDSRFVIDIVQYIFLGGIIGARLGEFLLYHPRLLFSDPLVLFRVGEGGMASHGGLIGIAVALWFFCRRYAFRFSWVFDRLALIGVIIVILMRIGNLMNSELLGIPTNGHYGFVFVLTDPQLLPRHPVVLYEALIYVPVFFLLLFLYLNGAGSYPWLLSGMYFSVLVTSRFFIEFLKESGTEHFMSLSYTQWLSVPLMLCGYAMVVYSLRKRTHEQLP